MRPMFRPAPKGPQAAYQTFRARQPLQTHFRRATCAEVDCARFVNGFRIPTVPGTPLGDRQAYLIRESGARHVTVRQPGGVVDYVFPPGTMCFERHFRSLFREPLTAITRGDHRTPRAARAPRVMAAAEWLDRFRAHQDKIATEVQRG